MAAPKAVTVLLFIAVIPLVCFCTTQPLNIDTNKPAFHTPRHFLSVSSSPKTVILHNRRVLHRMIRSEVFHSLVKGLSPTYWRFGGREALLVTFVNQLQDCPSPHFGHKSGGSWNDSAEAEKRKIPLCLTSAVFDDIYDLARKTNNLLLFDLNNRVRFANGSWDYRNVQKLVDYAMKKKYNVSWQLGNEPSSYFHQFDIVVNPEQLVKDYGTLRKLVGVDQIVVGPEMVDIDPHRNFIDELSSREYFQRWEDAGGDKLSNWPHKNYNRTAENIARIWSIHGFQSYNLELHERSHFGYYLHRAPQESDMYSSTVLDRLLIATNMIESYSKANTVDYWLTETGNVIGKYAITKFTDSYAAGFMWLHKLGIASRKGHTVVCHETLITLSRGLLDPSFDPQPTYWISYVFKRLVGTGTLAVEGQLQLHHRVHTFAFCTNAADLYVNVSYVAGDVTLLVINIQENLEATVSLPSYFMHSVVHVYHLTPGNNNLTSFSILLNGKNMQLGHNHQLPLLTPIEQAGSKLIRLPPLTYGFYVIRNAKASACL